MKLAVSMLFAVSLAAAMDDSLLLRGVTVFPVTGPKQENVSLLIVDGKIAEIGVKVVPPKGIRVIDGKGLSVYPGMIDSATEVGLEEISSVRETSDTNELGDFKPQLRAAIAVNPSSEHIPVIRANGITAAMAVPGGGIICGQAALMHLNGWTWEEMTVRRDAGMVVAFPLFSAGGGRFRRSTEAESNFAEARRTYDRRVKQLKDYMEAARAYQKAKAAGGKSFQTNLAFDAMIPVLEGKVPVVITAARERAIQDAVAWAVKEKLKIVIAGVRRPGKGLDVLKANRIPVILGPTQELPLEEDDPYDEAFTLPADLYKAGVKFAFGSFGNQFSRNLPYQAGTAAGFGLPPEEALKAVTINPAEIWGVDQWMGSIEKGKWANIMVTDGDPLEVRTQVKRLFIKGKEVDIESRHTKLYKKYLARP